MPALVQLYQAQSESESDVGHLELTADDLVPLFGPFLVVDCIKHFDGTSFGNGLV